MIRPAFIACLVTGAAAAEPRNIGDCEQIQAADAYNRCLAAFGPAVGAHSAHSALSFAPQEQTVSHSGKRSGGWADRAWADRGGADPSRRGRLRMMLTPGGR
ncbi:MAG TPA: hypothetical protein VIF40_03190 [Methylosinus sp.]|jgi:hypothetical protein|uniref:hypothetical protein n=1 Tax=Methylosinus sp. TaxID=427 RepID=UPI002F95D2D8